MRGKKMDWKNSTLSIICYRSTQQKSVITGTRDVEGSYNPSSPKVLSTWESFAEVDGVPIGVDRPLYCPPTQWHKLTPSQTTDHSKHCMSSGFIVDMKLRDSRFGEVLQEGLGQTTM